MTIEAMAEIIGKYGIGAVVIIVLCFISYLIIKHILKQSDRILDSAMIAQKEWQRAIDDHTSQAREFHESVKEAHKFQREEHQKILDNQVNIGACLTKTLSGLDQVEKALGRINGYHDK